MNTFDVFPRRNLNPEAEPWGREVETRIYSLENQGQTGNQAVSGLNRSSAATLSNLAQQLNDLEEQIERVDNLYKSIPKTAQATAVAQNFGVSSAGWNTIAFVTFPPVGEGTAVISAQAHGQLISSSSSTLMGAQIRLVLNGSDGSTAMPGLPATPYGTWTNNMMVGWGWRIPLTFSSYTVAVQVLPDDPASWGAGTGSVMVLNATSTFTFNNTTPLV